MTREQRAQQLNCIRQSDPKRLIATYRAATKMPAVDQLPRGLGFSGMIAAILEQEFDTEPARDEALQRTEGAAQATLWQQSAAPPVEFAATAPREQVATLPLKQAAQRRPLTLLGELAAFCSGAAMVATGLLMAALYFVMTQQMRA
jgi:hypothetical protein